MANKHIPGRIWRKAQAILNQLQDTHWGQLGGKQLKPQIPGAISFRLSYDYRLIWHPDGRYRVLSHSEYDRALALRRIG